jgi:hypothetical protein
MPAGLLLLMLGIQRWPSCVSVYIPSFLNHRPETRGTSYETANARIDQPTQVSSFDFSNPGWSSGAGHFTQLVWKDTKTMGCAVNTKCSWPTYVCQYGPPGVFSRLHEMRSVRAVCGVPADAG